MDEEKLLVEEIEDDTSGFLNKIKQKWNNTKQKWNNTKQKQNCDEQDKVIYSFLLSGLFHNSL